MPTTPPLAAPRPDPAYGVGRGRGRAAAARYGLHAQRDRPPPGTTPPPHRSPDADPDVALAATVLADEQAMLDLVPPRSPVTRPWRRRLAAARDRATRRTSTC